MHMLFFLLFVVSAALSLLAALVTETRADLYTEFGYRLRAGLVLLGISIAITFLTLARLFGAPSG